MSTPINPQRDPGSLFSAMKRNSPVWSQSMMPFSPQQAQEIVFSAKHVGIHLHLARLLRPIWKKKCIMLPQCESTISHSVCTEILDDLYAIKSFLDSLPISNLTGENRLEVFRNAN